MIERKLTKASPLYDQAYSALLDMILNNKFEPNEKLTDAGLAQILGISRTPAREAVRQLVREGLLTGLPNRSVSVFQPTLKDFAELYSIRSALEGLAARLAFLNPEKSLFIDKMTKCLKSSKDAAKKVDTPASAMLNTQFHNLIIEASSNQNLITLFSGIKNKLVLYRLNSLKYQIRVNIALDEHLKLLELLKNGTEDECERTMKSHVLQAGLRILEQSDIKLGEDDPVYILFFNQVRQVKEIKK